MENLNYQRSHTCIIRHLNIDFKKSDNKIRSPFIQNIQTIIEENISDDEFGILELCKAIGLSRSQLHNKIKAKTGISTSIFVRNIRLRKAKILLHHSEMNVAEVAYEVGFKDPNYFSKLFSEKYNLSPSKIRR